MSDDERERDYIPVNVKPDTWTELNHLKRPGDSFDDVITRLLEERDTEGDD